MRFQRTLQRPAVCAGIGVHTGAHARIVLSPAAPGTGIVFVRTDLPAGENRIKARAGAIRTTELGTTLANEAGVSVATTEHLLAATTGLCVDNLLVEIDGPELPILDGSSAPFVQLILNAGVREQGVPAAALRVLEPIEVSCGSKRASLLPIVGDGFEMDVTIRFQDPAIGVQRRRLWLTPESFAQDIAAARTFGFMADLEALQRRGLGRGACQANAIAIAEGKVLNPEGLRFEDEFVRHKLLDAVGDLALLGAPIHGRFVAEQPGHALNAALTAAVLARPEAWRLEGADEALRAHAMN